MASQLNQLLKTLTPLLNKRLKELESGKVTPTTSSSSLLNNPHYTGGLSLKDYVLPANVTPTPDSYSKLTPGTLNLLNSVRRLKQEVPEQHHTSLLGHIWNDIEKPYHAVTGAIGEVNKEDRGKSTWDQLIHGWSALGKGAKEGWEGKLNLTSADLLNKKSPYSSHDFVTNNLVAENKVGRAIAGFGVDVGLDPTSYVGVGGLTKVKTLARTAEEISKAQEVERTLEAAGNRHASGTVETLLNPEVKQGRYYTKNQLGTSAQRTETIRHARRISQAYGNITYNKLFAENRIKAAQQLEKQGIREYKNLSDFRKFMKGDATEEDLQRFNASVQSDIETQAGRLTGDRKSFVEGKAQELLAIATKNNFAGDATRTSENLQKVLALKIAGQPLVKLRIPQSVVKGTESVVASDKLKGVREFSQAVHGHFNTVFRTGSHIDPLVNAMRMARHSSVVERMNNTIRNGNSIWGNVTRAEREDAAHAIAQGLHNVVYKGGHDHEVGQQVDNVIQWGIDQVKHIQSLVGERKSGRLLTFGEFNSQLPLHYRIPERYSKDPEFLQHAWRDYYLGGDAKESARHLYNFAKDPNVFLLAMKKAAFTGAADKELKTQIIRRFGHQLYPIDPKTGLKAKGRYTDPVAKVLVDKHGYRSPSWSPRPGVHQTIKGYEGAVFHNDVAKAIEAMDQMSRVAQGMNKGARNEVTQLFEKATNLFKTVVTKFNPGFHERNLIGEMFSSFADGVTSIQPYRKALQVLRLHGKQALDTGEILGHRKTLFGRTVEDSRIHNAILPDAYEQARIARIGGTDVILKKRFRDLGSTGVTSDQLWHAYVDNGLKTGWITTDTGKYAGRLGGANIGTRANLKVQHLTENIEDYARLAHFISRIQRSKLPDFALAAEEAASYVRKFHFDYNDFTQTEKAVLSRVFPFYKWTRKNIPLQMMLLAQRPGYFTAQMHGLSAISQAMGFSNHGQNVPTAEEVMPQWLKDHLAVPVGHGSSGVRYLDAPLPTLQAMQFFGSSPLETEQNLAYMANPLIKTPLEIATGHQVGGTPIQTDKYAASQTPYTNLLYNLLNPSNTGKTTNLAQFVAGLGLTENTPARIKGELKREQSALAAARKKYRKQHHMQPLGYSLP